MRRAIAICLALGLLLSLYFGSLLGVSYYRRWQASKLLAIVRQLHPGATTEAQARALLKSFAAQEDDRVVHPDGRIDDEVNYEFVNSIGWPQIFPWTLFSVDLKFKGGLLAEIDLGEMQEDHPRYPHPNSAHVTIYSGRLASLPAHFNGYSEYSRATGSVDAQGRWTDFVCCHARFIKLDERATPSQLSAALNFRLSCMTSFIRCKDDRQILP